jgi:hypothetical protein
MARRARVSLCTTLATSILPLSIYEGVSPAERHHKSIMATVMRVRRRNAGDASMEMEKGKKNRCYKTERLWLGS